MIFVICHKINQPIMKYRITLLSIIFISYNYSFSQEHETHTIEEKAHEVVEDSHQEPHQEEHDAGHHKKHAISVVISHTHIKENQDKINLIKKLLSKPEFAYLRINELSDIRILDMYYWFKENRE